LDDTLLRSDLTISYRTRNVIKKTESTGIIVALASARVQAALDRFVRHLGMHKRPGYIISNNGALVQESSTGKIVHEARIASETALIVCDLASAEGFPVQLYEDDIMYVSRHNEYTAYDQRITGLRQVVVENFRAMVGQGCYKLHIPGDPKILLPLENYLRANLDNDITLSTTKPYLLEILPAETNKGTALARIAALLGIDAEECMAIGDSMNDEAMIRWAGLGVAMVNGDERIKSIAQLVTEHSNDDDGAAEIIDRYLLSAE
jgi:Cof subfamily protein (haloacid dehalogenase superfamily)